MTTGGRLSGISRKCSGANSGSSNLFARAPGRCDPNGAARSIVDRIFDLFRSITYCLPDFRLPVNIAWKIVQIAQAFPGRENWYVVEGEQPSVEARSRPMTSLRKRMTVSALPTLF